MKKSFFALFFSIAAIGVCFSYAFAETAQEGSGGGGGDASSAGYQVKTAVADPGVSTSQSVNYLYDHGTLWFDDETAGIASPPSPATSPPDGGGGGSGGGGSSGGGGGSGSGWISSLFGDNAQIGGVSPAADVSFTDTPAVTEAVKDIPRAVQEAVRIEDMPGAITRVLESPRPVPRILRAVDNAGTVRELNLVLVKRIFPWLVWLALALVALGGITLAAFATERLKSALFAWLGGAGILLGLAIGFYVRFAYRLPPPDIHAIVSSQTVSVGEVNDAVKKLMNDLPVGAHIITAKSAEGTTVLDIKVFVRLTLPF